MCVCVCVCFVFVFFFQEAHKMVREANVKQANAEKQLKEALGKVTALNTHVCTLLMFVVSNVNTLMKHTLLSFSN